MCMRVLFVPINYGVPQYSMYEAWTANGVDFDVFDWWNEWESHHDKIRLNEDFVAKALQMKPDCICMQLNYQNIIITPESLQIVKRHLPNVIISNWTGDIRYEIDDFTPYAQIIDYPLISSTGQMEYFRSKGCHKVGFLPLAYNPKEFFPMGKTSFTYDVCFVGSNYGNVFKDGLLRADAVNLLHTTFGDKFCLYGRGFDHINRGASSTPAVTNETYNNSICNVSINNDNTIDDYFSDRILCGMATGRPTISWYFPKIENHFLPGKEVLVAHNAQEVIDLVRWCKAHPEEASEIGRNGYEKVSNNNTCYHMIKKLLGILQGK